MTKKNTLSILENIKKKMQKFDEKPKKIETISGVDDEFEYISSSNKYAADKPKLTTPDFSSKDILPTSQTNIEPVIEKISVNDSAVTNVLKNNSNQDDSIFDNLGLDDLGLDDSHHPQEEKLTTPEIKVDSNNQTEELEKSSETILVKKQDPMLDPKLDLNYQEVHDDLDLDLDLDLSLDLDLVEEEKNEHQDSLKEGVIPEEKMMSSSIETASDLDLELEEELSKLENQTIKPIQNKAIESQAEKPKINQSIKNIDDLDLDDLLKEEEILNEESQQKISNQTNNSESKEPTELDIELEFNQNKNDAGLDDLQDLEKEIYFSQTEAKNDLSSENEKLEQVKKSDVKSEEGNLENLEKITERLNSEMSFKDIFDNQDFAEITMNILEPKLDTWLDQHLHGLVEKIVQEEVKKLFDKNK